MDLSENEQKILRYLFWNHDQYRTRSDVTDETDLSYEQVRDASNKLLERDLIWNKPDEQKNISDKHRYMISSEGIQYVKQNDLRKSEKAELRKEVREVRKEVMTRDDRDIPWKKLANKIDELEKENEELRDEVEFLKSENRYLMHYVKQFIRIFTESSYDLEPFKKN